MDARRDLNGSATSPHELDVVEVVVDNAEVPCGTKGTVVHDFGDGTLMLEVVGEEGRTEGLPCVSRQDVRVVWSFQADHARAAAQGQPAG
jgi:hypothetical protein